MMFSITKKKDEEKEKLLYNKYNKKKIDEN